jgi:DNA-binding NarL/FixJ family response regulator
MDARMRRSPRCPHPYRGAMATSVVIAEDDFLVREGLRLLLSDVPGVTLIAVCETYEQLIAAVERQRPNVVITDIRMPPTWTDEGIRAVTEIRSRWPDTGVVVLSQYADPAGVQAVFQHGTDGIAYLLKERVGDLDRLVAAVRAVSQGGSFVDPKVVEVLVGTSDATAGRLLDRLTAREREVLAHVARGETNAAIGHALGLSERAVEKHINSIFAKLDLDFEEQVNKRVRAVVVWLTEAHP